ncbi:MAG: hypothetical protein NWQ28_08275, partial [Nodularia sp. (in: cyanobacteria)]|nr:hypothetical protein [Nodularia sp. (in: cyanobacteria)]
GSGLKPEWCLSFIIRLCLNLLGGCYKTAEANWLLRESDNEDGVLTLAAANCQIPHRQIYERVKFSNQPE